MNLNLKQNLYELLRNIRWDIIRLLHKNARKNLMQQKYSQINSFNNAAENFEALYNSIQKFDISHFVTKPWHQYNDRIEHVFLPVPPFDFLKNPVVMETMFVTRGGKCLKEEIKSLKKTIPDDDLKRLLIEDYVGDPLIFNSEYITSHNRIHTGYHLNYFLKVTKCNIKNINSVVEWGGGYGTMAVIFSRYKKCMPTYIIIDTPLFSCIQWLYLSSVIGKDNVNFISNASDNIKSGVVNLIPLCFVNNYNLLADLFISTWALSESSVISQNFVFDRNWFDAKHLLLAFQKSDNNLPYASRVGNLSLECGANIEEIKFLPGNYYSFY